MAQEDARGIKQDSTYMAPDETSIDFFSNLPSPVTSFPISSFRMSFCNLPSPVTASPEGPSRTASTAFHRVRRRFSDVICRHFRRRNGFSTGSRRGNGRQLKRSLTMTSSTLIATFVTYQCDVKFNAVLADQFM